MLLLFIITEGTTSLIVGTRGPRATLVRATSVFCLDGAYTKLNYYGNCLWTAGKSRFTVIMKFESKLMMTGSKKRSWEYMDVLTLQYAPSLAALLVRNKIGRTKRVYTCFRCNSVRPHGFLWLRRHELHLTMCFISLVRGRQPDPVILYRPQPRTCATSSARSCTWVMRLGVLVDRCSGRQSRPNTPLDPPVIRPSEPLPQIPVTVRRRSRVNWEMDRLICKSDRPRERLNRVRDPWGPVVWFPFHGNTVFPGPTDCTSDCSHLAPQSCY